MLKENNCIFADLKNENHRGQKVHLLILQLIVLQYDDRIGEGSGHFLVLHEKGEKVPK